MTAKMDPASVIEGVLSGTVFTRIRDMTDGELALEILDALDAAGFDVVPKDGTAG